MSYRRRGRWMGGCGCDPKRIVYPVKQEVVHCCTEETVEHIHPSHTTVCNQHIIKNKHVYPHTTSQEYAVQEVNITDPGNWGYDPNHHHGHHHHGHHHHGHHHGGGHCCKPKHHHKKKKWC